MPVKVDDYREEYEARKEFLIKESVERIDEFLKDSARITAYHTIRIPVALGFLEDAFFEDGIDVWDKPTKRLTGIGCDVSSVLCKMYIEFGWKSVRIVPSDDMSYFLLEINYEPK